MALNSMTNAIVLFILLSVSDSNFRNPPSGLVADRVQGRHAVNLDADLQKNLSQALNMSSSV